MAQISRPFQIAALALVLFVAVWFVALHGHSSTSGSGSPAPSTPPPSAAAQAQKAAAPSPVYHGAAPGVSGLTRAIDKAHGAVATSQQNAKQLEEKSAQASSPTSSTTQAPTRAAPAAPAGSAVKSKAPAVPATTVKRRTSLPSNPTSSAFLAPQRAVEAELKQGKVVVLLFWNPKGADDVVAHDALKSLVGGHGSGKAGAEEVGRVFKGGIAKHVAVHEASQRSVASYGSITRGVQVYSTPTMLFINPHGRVITMTGSTDAYSIEQAIEEAKAS
jgi:hypothetical protein